MRYIFLLSLFVCLQVSGQYPGIVAASQGGAAAASFDLTDLLYYYDFNETTGSLIDVHGALDMTVEGTPTREVSGKLNDCYTFDGSDDYCVSSTNVTFTNLTISAWVSPNNTSSARSIIGQTAAGLQFRINDTDHLELLSSGVALIGASTGTIPTTGWTHVAVTYNADGDYIFYINGSTSGSGNSDRDFIDVEVYIGAKSTLSAEPFSGEIDEVAIYSVVKSGTIISNLYNSGNGLSYPY